MAIKNYLRQNLFIDAFLRQKRISSWIKLGYPIPVPHAVKQLAILYHASANKLNILVETGTFLGDMVWAQRKYFEKIYSIELSEQLYQKAKKRFRNFHHISIIQGDSSDKIGMILSEINSPAIFWLDGHYSGGITAKGVKVCPIYAELTHIFKSNYSHIILIDDARLFTGVDDYPTLEDLNAFILKHSSFRMKVENDIIIVAK